MIKAQNINMIIKLAPLESDMINSVVLCLDDDELCFESELILVHFLLNW